MTGKVTRQNFAKVVDRLQHGDFDPDEQSQILARTLEMLSDYVTAGRPGADDIAAHFDVMLEDFARWGFFGHERQRDPRK